MDKNSPEKDRIERILNLIMQLAGGNLDARAEMSDSNDELDAVIAGMNMLAEELQRSMVSIRELEENQKRIREYEKFFSMSFDMLCIANSEGYFVKVNHAFETVLGYSEAELISKPFIDFVHKDDVEDTLHEIDTLNEGIPTVNFENRYRCQDGTYKWLNWSATPNTEENLIYAVASDVTEKKMAETQLIEREQRFRALFDNASLGIMINQPDGDLFNANQALLDMLGYTHEELREISYTDFTHPDDVAKSQKFMEDMDAGKIDRFKLEKRYVKKDGKTLWGSTSVSRLTDFMGRKMNIIMIENITSRKKLEQSLINTNILQKAILDSANFTIISTDRKGQVKTFNKTAEKLLGYKASEVINKKSVMIFHDLDEVEKRTQKLNETLKIRVDPGFLTFVAKTIETEKPDEFEMSYIRKDGSRFPVLLSITPLRDEEGNITGFLGIGQDITEKKKAQEELRQSEERYRAIYDQAYIGIATIGKVGKFISVNQRLSDMLGYTAEELSRKTFFELTHPDDLNSNLKNWDMLLSGEIDNFSSEQTYMHKSGREVITNLTVSLVKDGAGNPDYYVAVYEDITERKQAEEELNKLSLVARNTDNGVLISDESGRVEWVNEGFTRITGYSLEEMKGKRPSEILLGPKSNLKTIEEAKKKEARKEPYTIEILNYRKDGTPIWLSVVNTPVKDKNQLEGKHIEIINDITEKKKTELELIKAKELAEKSVKVKEEFLANMSHEIRTPLNSIIGFTDVLSDSDLSPDQQDSIGAIKQAGENLMVIINDILDFSKIEAGKLNIEHTHFKFSKVIRSVKNLFRQRAADKKIKLLFEVGEDIPEVLIGDPVRINQILVNLVGNAIKFTQKGWVELAVGCEKISEKDCELKLKVEDTGIGIPKEKLEHIFEGFTQASSDTARKYGGTGLGLAIVHQLTHLMGGTINVESEPGKGTVFNLTLKMEVGSLEEYEKNREPAYDAVDNLQGLKILLCEDNEMNQKLAKKLLVNQWGTRLDIAENGKEGFELFREDDYDLILMDVQMPEMDGFETTRKIRNYENEEKAKIPIIAMTADALKQEREKCFEAGMDDYVAKPFSQSELINKIFNQTRRKSGPEKPEPTREKGQEEGGINLNPLRELTGGDPSFMAEMIGIFLKNSPGQLEEMKKLAENQEWAQLKKEAHKIKSSFGMMGMKTAAEMCEDIEDIAMEKPDKGRLLKMIAKLEKDFEQAEEELQSLLKEFNQKAEQLPGQ